METSQTLDSGLSIDISELKTGIHLIKVMFDENTILTQKFVKQ